MSNLSEKYFIPAKLHPVIENGKLRIIILNGGMGYIGSVEIKVWNRLKDRPDITAEFIPNIENGSITGINVIDGSPVNSITEYLESTNNGGSGYTVLPQIIITPEQEVLGWENFTPSDIRRRPFAFFMDSLDNLPDSADTPTGARVTLTTSAFDILWDDLTFNWDDLYHGFRPAQFNVILDQTDGSIEEVEILDGGMGYTNDPILTFINNDTIDIATATVSRTNGSVTSVNLTNPGIGYNTAPEVVLSGGVPVSAIHTWDTLGYGNYYEMEWVVKGPRKFQYKKRGRIDDLREHEVVLPYVGLYDVELLLYDTANTINNLIKKNFIEVVIPNVSFSGFYRHLEKLDTWDDLDRPWDDLIGTWVNPMYQEQNLEDINISWEDFHMENFRNVGLDNVPKSDPVLTVLDINENDVVIGEVLSVIGNDIILKDSKIQPPPQNDELVYFRVNKTILSDKIDGVTNLYYSEGINGIIPDQEDQSGNTTFAITLNHSNGEYQNGETLQEYVVENSESSELYEEPEIIATPIGTLDLSNISFSEDVDFNILTNSINISNNDLIQAILDNLDYEVSPVNKYYLRFFIRDVNGNTQNLKVEIQPSQIDVGLGLNGKYGILKISPGAEIIPDIVFDTNTKYVSPPNVAGFYSFSLEYDASDSPVVITPTYFKVNRGQHNLTSRIICEYSESTFTILNSGKWMYNTPIFLDVNLGHRVTGILNTENAELSMRIQNTDNLQRIGEGWQVLRKIKNTVLVNGVQNQIKIGEWLHIYPRLGRERIEGLNVTGFKDIQSPVIIINGQLPSLDNNKIEIYRKFIYDDVVIVNVDLDNNKIYLDFGEDVSDMLEKFQPNNYDEIILQNNRYIILGAEFGTTNNELVIEVRAIDNTLEWLDTNYTILDIEYKWYKFITKVYTSTIVGNTTELLLDFNYWSYPHDFINNIEQFIMGSPVNIPTDWYIDLNINNGEGWVKILSKGTQDGNTILSVDDKWNDLWNCRIDSLCRTQYYDSRQTGDRLGINKITWDTIKQNNITWDDLGYFTWDMFHYDGAKIPTFKITKVEQGGKIQWNEEPEFEFTNIVNNSNSPLVTLTQAEIWGLAVDDLNQSDNSGIQRFNFYLDNEPNHTSIIAIAKVPGSDGLGSVYFRHGVEGEYNFDLSLSHSFPDFTMNLDVMRDGEWGVINQLPTWDHTTQVYLQGINPGGEFGWYPKQNLPRIYQSDSEKWRADRIAYLPAVSGDIQLDEMRFLTKNWVSVPRMTTIFFTPQSNIRGKVEWVWELWKGDTKIIDSSGKYFTWNFIDVGVYDVKLIIKDNKGNIKDITKKGIVEVNSKI